jgi:FKBP-type peptidyl-prolyl cis-trans isomerase 2
MIKKGDFIELDYTGRLKDDKIVFDTTVEETAKVSNNYNKDYKYAPAIICVGEHHLLDGLDEALMGKNPGKYTFEIKPEQGFGKKDAKLLKLLPLKLFAKEQIQPFVGLDVNIDGEMGIVRSVSGGRVIVDFNHPLSGKDLVYDVDVKRIVTDPLEQVKAILGLFHIEFETIDIADENASIILKTKLHEEITSELSENIQKLTKLKIVKFEEIKLAEKKAEPINSKAEPLKDANPTKE